MAIAIELEPGRERTLKFGVLAARQFKKQFNVSLIDYIQPAFGGGDAGKSPALDLDWATNVLWALLLQGQKSLTLDKTAELLEAYLTPAAEGGGGGTLRKLYDAFGEALDESARIFGAKDDAESPEGKA